MYPVLVTGSEGFIGKHVMKSLSSVHYIDVKGFDKVLGDSLDDIYEATTENGCIVHLASLSRAGKCKENPEECFLSNVIGTIHVLNAAREKKCKLLFASTYTVGSDEPPNLYTASKHTGESLCENSGIVDGLEYTIIRLPDVYGEGDNPDKVIPTLTRKAMSGEDIVLTNPNQLFDFMHVSSIVGAIEGVVLGWESGSVLQELTTLSSSKLVSLRDTAKRIVKELKSKSRIIENE